MVTGVGIRIIADTSLIVAGCVLVLPAKVSGATQILKEKKKKSAGDSHQLVYDRY